jgi:hypothetical protein
MLLKAYDIAPDTNAKDNFTDVPKTYYTGYLAAAKRLEYPKVWATTRSHAGKEIRQKCSLCCTML